MNTGTCTPAAVAAELAAQGVVKGDRVAVIMRNLPEWPVAFFAGILVGVVGGSDRLLFGILEMESMTEVEEHIRAARRVISREIR